MKKVLTKAQSAKLIDLGIDTGLASRRQVENLVNKGLRNTADKYDIFPVFTLEDILSILPKEIYSKDRNLPFYLNIMMLPNLCKVFYRKYSPKSIVPVMSAPELIDALFQLLIWCLEQGYCKCGKGGGR